MIILTNEKYLDFEAPIQMTLEQRKKFIEFMRELTGDSVEVVSVPEKYKEMGEREYTFKNWTEEEYEQLLSTKTNEELAVKLNRSLMSVTMQRGHFVPDVMVWVKKKKYSFPPNKQQIKEFLEEREQK